MHIARYPNTAAKYRIFLHHGVGTNGRQLNMIFEHKMAALGYEVVAMDNLGYGLTEVKQKDILYQDWIQRFTDFINKENKRDYKKTILYELSAGGMLVYSVACHLKDVHGILKKDEILIRSLTFHNFKRRTKCFNKFNYLLKVSSLKIF